MQYVHKLCIFCIKNAREPIFYIPKILNSLPLLTGFFEQNMHKLAYYAKTCNRKLISIKY